MSEPAQRIVEAVLSVTGGPVASHPPRVEEDDYKAVLDQMGDMLCYGPINAFEHRLKKACGRAHCVATSSGTAALELALAAVGVEPGDTVVVPAISFVAAANAVVRCGAIPQFIDIEPRSLGLDPARLKAFLEERREWNQPAPAAIIAVHVLGHPCKIQDISDIAFFNGRIPLIEDAAEALGSTVTIDPGGDESPDIHPCGYFGTVSVLSFNLNKIVTTGGGGAVLTDHEALDDKMRSLATTARIATPAWEITHSDVAWNHRISMLAGALGASQVQRLNDLVMHKRALARAYQQRLERIPDVTFHGEPNDTTSNFWLPTIMVPPEEREAVLTALNGAGLGCRALFKPIDQIKPHLRHSPCRVADSVYRRAVCLPAGIELARRFK